MDSLIALCCRQDHPLIFLITHISSSLEDYRDSICLKWTCIHKDISLHRKNAQMNENNFEEDRGMEDKKKHENDLCHNKVFNCHPMGLCVCVYIYSFCWFVLFIFDALAYVCPRYEANQYGGSNKKCWHYVFLLRLLFCVTKCEFAMRILIILAADMAAMVEKF